jgi:hypothetical protein
VILRAPVPGSGPAATPRPGSRASLAVVGLAITAALSLGGCAALTGGGGAAGEEDSTPGSGPSWFWQQQGVKAGSAPAPAGSPATSSAISMPPLTPPSAPSDSPRCLSRIPAGTGTIGATGGAGTGTVVWNHVADPRIVEYRVAAIAQDRPGGDDLPAATWTTVAKPDGGCQEMTVTVSGLTSGIRYVFWLDAVITVGTGTREPMIGRSNVFLVG